ncbi:MAG: DUF5684 domain-containing protein [Bacilli bacterium]
MIIKYNDFLLPTPTFILILKIIGVFSIITLVMTVLVMFCSKLFKKSNVKSSKAFIPVYNLFVLTQICEIPIYFALLFFFPVSNIIFFEVILFNLAHKFNLDKKNTILLMIFPIVFLPLLSFKEYEYTSKKEEKIKLDNVSDVMPSILPQEELDKKNLEVVEEKENTDSIFKSHIQLAEEVEPYKAQDTFVEPVYIPEEVLIDPLTKEERGIIKEVEEEKSNEFVDEEDIIEIVDL